MNITSQTGAILIVTADKIEAQAVLKTFSPGQPAKRQMIAGKIYYDLGSHGGAPVFMVQSEQGVATSGGALLTTSQAIQALRPQAIIMCGIAYGLRKNEQKLGDILVSKQLEYYDPQKVDRKLGKIQRGDRATASERLLDRFRGAELEWTGAPLHFGLILSGEKLVNDPTFRNELLTIEPEAIGGEMEGAGLYAAAKAAGVDWILVKAIYDWADGKKKENAQLLAADHAAQFVFYVLEMGEWGKNSPARSTAEPLPVISETKSNEIVWDNQPFTTPLEAAPMKGANKIRLNGKQQAALEEALLDAFPSKDELARMIQYRLSKNLEAIALGDNLAIIVFKLIQAAQAQGWLETLIARAREANPENPVLAAFCQQIGLSPHSPENDALERMIVQQNLFCDVNTWRQKLGELENQVCRVEVKLSQGGTSYGTGFLIAANLLLTNYHVMEPVIRRDALRQTGQVWAAPQQVVLRFDYKVLAGSTVNPGSVYQLADDWLVDSSPASHWDNVAPPKAGDPQPDELDYALLRLKGSPGKDPVGLSPQPGAFQRGWVKVPQQEYPFPVGSALLILQHPNRTPLKLSLDTNAILGLNGNQTRVTYRTNTESGSSGSPCFNLNWELVALHHAGDPGSFAPQYNQGIPIRAILKLLEARGKKQEIGGE
jgi:nucleoside phosphorylase